MKKYSKQLITMLAGLLFSSLLVAQGTTERVKENAKWKTENKVNQKVDRAIDDVLDGNIFKKKKKKQAETETEESGKEGRPGGAGKPKDDNTTGSGNATTAGDRQTPGFTAYSKFDFVPGDKVIAFEDFSQDAVGDFPAQWNTNGSGEVVTTTLGPGKWFKFSGEGIFYPEFLNVLDENITIEFEIGTSPTGHVKTNILFVDAKSSPNLLSFNRVNMVELSLDPLGTTEIYTRDGNNTQVLENNKEQKDWLKDGKAVAKVSIWRQKNRLRVYVNETKIWDIPRAFQPNVSYRMVMSTSTYFLKDREVYLTNFKAAIGAPDTRNKLVTQGSFSTTGILFDFQKATIRPESYGVMKEIADLLKENSSMRVKIVGHTSNDGDPNANLALSKQRAAAVKAALSKEFGIADNRIETDGVGGTQPVDNSGTPAGKANNRRVEFIKL
jgi:outer membrane protein OmpA-like peptidoglycan-associated protein